MIKKRYLDVDVLTAAKERIIIAFNSGNPIRLSFSGGKDSIVLADILYNLINQGKINQSQLTVTFIDEEAMYDDVIEIVKKWRVKFIQVGVKFDWCCLQVKHFNCLNSLTDEEGFVCWDETQRENWVRQPPEFAIRSHPLLEVGKDTYQKFLSKVDNSNGNLTMIGTRVSESIQRYKMTAVKKEAVSNNKCMPLYDWTDKDIWLYIYKYGIEIPETYENLYRIGTNVNKLRISQFFSIDTAKSLVSMNEMYPDLMERVIRREPNAYLCAMYWDTEMFGKSTQKRRKLENAEDKDYRSMVIDLIKNTPPDFNKNQLYILRYIKQMLVQFGQFFTQKDYKAAYENIITGDPKNRALRAFLMSFFAKYRG